METDVFDTVLDGLRIRSSVFARMLLRSPWGFEKPTLQGSPFYIVVSGHCLFRTEGHEVVEGAEGDVIILPRGTAHDLVEEPSSAMVPFKSVIAELGWAAWTPGMRYKTGILHYGSTDGSLTKLIAGVFDFENFDRNPLLWNLPRILHLRTNEALTNHDGLASIVRMLTAAVEARTSGSGPIASRLADLLFVETVRCHLASTQVTRPGWPLGLDDPQVGRAISMIHAEPGRAWTVAGLGAAVGMSRAAFARRFQSIVGRSPIDYLTQWRMYVASIELMTEGRTLAAIAHICGYGSEISFSRAFRRWSGLLPTEYRLRQSSQSGE